MVTPDRCTPEARERILAENLLALEKEIDRLLLAHDWETKPDCYIDVTRERREAMQSGYLGEGYRLQGWWIYRAASFWQFRQKAPGPGWGGAASGVWLSPEKAAPDA